MLSEKNLPIPPEKYDFLRQKARHEYGHLICARMLGFNTGNVTLKLLSLEGDHRAATEIMIHEPIRNQRDIIDFLERRIVTLFSGSMAEAPCAEDVGDEYVEEICFQSDGGGNDHGKIQELIGLHLNISQPDSMSESEIVSGRSILYAKLRARSAQMIRNEYDLIDSLAAQHAAQIRWLNVGWGYTSQDIDAMPQIQARFGVHQ